MVWILRHTISTLREKYSKYSWKNGNETEPGTDMLQWEEWDQSLWQEGLPLKTLTQRWLFQPFLLLGIRKPAGGSINVVMALTSPRTFLYSFARQKKTCQGWNVLFFLLQRKKKKKYHWLLSPIPASNRVRDGPRVWTLCSWDKTQIQIVVWFWRTHCYLSKHWGLIHTIKGS